MKWGYYWVEFGGEITIGYYGDIYGEYNKERYSDGSGEDGEVFTWKLIGSDEIYKNREVKVIREVS